MMVESYEDGFILANVPRQPPPFACIGVRCISLIAYALCRFSHRVQDADCRLDGNTVE